jgi:hypothetical protein
MGVTVAEVAQYALANDVPYWIGVGLENPSNWDLT